MDVNQPLWVLRRQDTRQPQSPDLAAWHSKDVRSLGTFVELKLFLVTLEVKLEKI